MRAKPVTWVIVAATAAVFLFVQQGRFSPVDLAREGGVLAGRGYWRWVAAIFLHAGWIHLAFNMLALADLGGELEPMDAGWKFAVVYLISGIVGNAGLAALGPVNMVGVGASGAIFGVAGAMWGVSFWRPDRRGFRELVVYLAVPTTALTLFIPNIAWQAHLFGFFSGWLLAWVLRYGAERKPGEVEVRGLESGV